VTPEELRQPVSEPEIADLVSRASPAHQAIARRMAFELGILRGMIGTSTVVPHPPSGEPTGDFFRLTFALRSAEHLKAFDELAQRADRQGWAKLTRAELDAEEALAELVECLRLERDLDDQEQLEDNLRELVPAAVRAYRKARAF